MGGVARGGNERHDHAPASRLTVESGRSFTVMVVTTMRIAEVAERTGVQVTTLRYYEEIRLLAPAGRSGNGYREYADRDLERLAFITRAKRLDISR